MNYKDHYDNLINRARNRILEGYKESHHVIPKCIGGNDEKDNLVDLTAREHFIAHLLLWKIHPESYGLIKAISMMCMGHKEHRSGNRMYGWLKEHFSSAMSSSQSGEGNSQFGTMWIHNLDLKESKKVPKNSSLEDGWELGRVLDFSKKECRYCGKIKCIDKNICSNHGLIRTFKSTFGMTNNKETFYEEYYSIIESLKFDYYDMNLSARDISKKYNTSSQHIDGVLKRLNFTIRNHKEAYVSTIKKQQNMLP